MFQSLIDVVLPVFLVIGSGYLTTYIGYFSAIQIETLLKFTQGFAIPCLLFQAIVGIDLSASFDAGLLFTFYLSALACFAIGLAGARLVFRRDWEDCVVIGFCCLFSNSVLLGLPITERAFGPENLAGNYIIVALHAPFCYGLGVTVMEVVRSRGKSGRAMAGAVLSAMFKNVLIIGIGLGFVFNLLALPVPQIADDALSLISSAALPCALFALGGVLVAYRPEGDFRVIAFICMVALFVHPAQVWGVGTAIGLQEEFFRSALVTAAMAPGFNAYIFANMYGRAKRVVASSVLIATSVSVLTVWLWLIALGAR